MFYLEVVVAPLHLLPFLFHHVELVLEVVDPVHLLGLLHHVELVLVTQGLLEYALQ